MLKHCHSSSVRLQRRCVLQPDSLSLNSTLTVQSAGAASEASSEVSSSASSDSSSLNSSFILPHHHHHHRRNSSQQQQQQVVVDHQQQPEVVNNNHQNNVYNARSTAGGGGLYDSGAATAPPSLSSRASSYASLVVEGAGQPRTSIKVYASCLRADLEYKTLSVGAATTASEIIWQLLAKFRMKYRDPKLFFLTMEVVIPRPGRDGLTKKTLVLEEDSRPAELKSCNPWGECRFSLQMRKGGLVKIHDSILMEESQYKCLLISEDTSVEEVVKILLYCYGLEQVERPDRYCLYEQCAGQRYQRRLASDDRPLAIQSLWPGSGQFSFVLRRSLQPRESVWGGQQQQPRTSPGQQAVSLQKVTVATNTRLRPTGDSSLSVKASEGAREQSGWLADAFSPHSRTLERLSGPAGGVVVPHSGYTITVRHVGGGDSQPQLMDTTPAMAADITSESGIGSRSGSSSSGGSRRESSEREETAGWPELDKDSEDMDTSLSSNDSPTPPLTSTPLAASAALLTAGGKIRQFGRSRPPLPPLTELSTPPQRPAMAFLYPSPDYATFPSRHIPCRPYSALSSSSSSSCHSLGAKTLLVAPHLPPKPASLAALFGGGQTGASSSSNNSSSHDYENYFYI